VTSPRRDDPKFSTADLETALDLSRDDMLDLLYREEHTFGPGPQDLVLDSVELEEFLRACRAVAWLTA